MTEQHGRSTVTTGDADREGERERRASSEELAYYEIKLKGHLDSHWSEWFDELAVTYDQRGDTILYGPIGDQAALHGLLAKVRDLGLPLLSVNRYTG